MTAVVVALCVAFGAVGYLARSVFAAIDRGAERRARDASRERWRARVRELQDRLDASLAADYLRDRLGPDGWLYDALAAVYAEARPGERAENLTIQVRWKDSEDDTTLIGINLGDVAERAAMLSVTNGEACWQQPEDIDLPDPDSPRWGSSG
jgi:hypothetical protein